MQELRLDVKIAVETVGPIVKVLGDAKESDNILLYMRHNGGGDVQQMFVLIQAISTTRATVTITFGRYIMSAAAALWLWFLVNPAENVKSVLPRKPAVIMYHRPRWMTAAGDRYCFAGSFSEQDPRRGPLEEKIALFDLLFEELLLLLGWNEETAVPLDDNGVSFKHWLHHLSEAYYGNKDCVIPVEIEEMPGE